MKHYPLGVRKMVLIRRLIRSQAAYPYMQDARPVLRYRYPLPVRVHIHVHFGQYFALLITHRHGVQTIYFRHPYGKDCKDLDAVGIGPLIFNIRVAFTADYFVSPCRLCFHISLLHTVRIHISGVLISEQDAQRRGYDTERGNDHAGDDGNNRADQHSLSLYRCRSLFRQLSDRPFQAPFRRAAGAFCYPLHPLFFL